VSHCALSNAPLPHHCLLLPLLHSARLLLLWRLSLHQRNLCKFAYDPPWTSLVLTFAPLTLIVVLVTTPFANHFSSLTSSTGASCTTSSTGFFQTSDVVIFPSGTGIIASPLTIALGLGPPKPYLYPHCDA